MTREDLQSPWRYALLLACLCWLALVFAPPLAIAAGWPYGELLHWLLHPVCHQIPERSFHLLGEPLAACARCTGLYLGFTLGVVAWPHLPRLARALAERPRWVLVFMVPLAVDVWVENTALSRFATGLVAAFPCALLPLLAIAEQTEAQNQTGGDPG
ncbi:MAG: DUF2085 domain-containing protein [Gammaproteobacteria bacterium]|nr:DUF2085 domain-containing protein [Gammaproteobacteria bacterium]